ncbi:MAG TPA: hypothetical protein EYG53_08535, partial [Gammaproteobacteria bacterium]|nr:hypothetical protein [Gammaproteobacteria bacterium]
MEVRACVGKSVGHGNPRSMPAAGARPQQRQRLERLCRYITRPAVCLERLSTNAAG